MDDAAHGYGLRRYWKGHLSAELPDGALDAFLAREASGHDQRHLSNGALQSYGGAIAEVDDAPAAFSHRDALVEFIAAARWTDPAEDAERIDAAREYATGLAPYASGAYVNALGDRDRSDLGRTYWPHKLPRLVEIKRAFDPENVFHHNHNIPPDERL